MIDMKYSEENYKENINNKNLKFIGDRRDGFGAKMNSILNAMYCSKKINIPFGFTWINHPYCMKDQKDSDKHVLGPYIGDVDNVFSPEFINAYYLDESHSNWPEHYYDIIKGLPFDKLLYYPLLREDGWHLPWTRLDVFFSGVDTNDYEQTVRECWKEIGFSEKFKSIINYVDTLKNQYEDFICIHVRSGDIIYSFLYALLFTYKALPAELALKVILDNIKHTNIILFGEDLGSLRKIKNAAEKIIGSEEKNKIYLSVDLVKEEFSTGIDLTFFDSYLMSRGKVLYGPESSSLSLYASLISETSNYKNCYTFFPAAEQYEAIKKYIDVLQLHPYQQSFSYLHLFYLAQKLGYALEIQLGYLQKAMECHPEKIAYKILFMWMLLQHNKITELDEFVKKLTLAEVDAMIAVFFGDNFALQLYDISKAEIVEQIPLPVLIAYL